MGKPANVGKFVAQVISRHSKDVSEALNANIAEKIVKLEKADAQLTSKAGAAIASHVCAPAASSQPPIVLIAAGSDSDMPHLEALKKELAKFKIESEIRICSAHKQPARLESLIAEYNKANQPVM